MPLINFIKYIFKLLKDVGRLRALNWFGADKVHILFQRAWL